MWCLEFWSFPSPEWWQGLLRWLSLFDTPCWPVVNSPSSRTSTTISRTWTVMSAFGEMALDLQGQAEIRWRDLQLHLAEPRCKWGQYRSKAWCPSQGLYSCVRNQSSHKFHSCLANVFQFHWRTDAHPSKSDAKTHYTIDAYDKDVNGLDKPIGCIHMRRWHLSTIPDPSCKGVGCKSPWRACKRMRQVTSE